MVVVLHSQLHNITLYANQSARDMKEFYSVNMNVKRELV